eukprot:1698846-Lingulodinium_polyedra.AAC.1
MPVALVATVADSIAVGSRAAWKGFRGIHAARQTAKEPPTLAAPATKKTQPSHRQAPGLRGLK